MAPPTRKGLRGLTTDRDLRVSDYVMGACKEGRRTPTRFEMVEALGLSVGIIDGSLARLKRQGVLEMDNRRTNRLVWHWRPTGDKTRVRSACDLDRVRDYVRKLCKSHRLTPTAEQVATALGLGSGEAARNRLLELEKEGDFRRDVTDDGAFVWYWLPSGSCTRANYKAVGVNPIVPRPARPTSDEITAARKAMESCRYLDDPKAVRDVGWGRAPSRQVRGPGSAAALCVEAG